MADFMGITSLPTRCWLWCGAFNLGLLASWAHTPAFRSQRPALCSSWHQNADGVAIKTPRACELAGVASDIIRVRFPPTAC